MVTNRILESLRRNFEGDEFKNFEALDFLHTKGSAKNAILHAALFFPEFIEFDGIVLLKTNVWDKEVLKDAYFRKESGKYDKHKLEKSFNYLEVLYCFGYIRDLSSLEDEELLSELVAESWRCRLKTYFPNRSFEVGISPPGEISDVFCVYFKELG